LPGRLFTDSKISFLLENPVMEVTHAVGEDHLPDRINVQSVQEDSKSCPHIGSGLKMTDSIADLR